jgi:hypothetical protein
MDTGIIIWIILIIAGFALFCLYAKAGRPVSCVFMGAATGLCSLGALWVAGHFVEIAVKVTPFTLTASVLLGVPGVIGMLVLPVLG